MIYQNILNILIKIITHSGKIAYIEQFLFCRNAIPFMGSAVEVDSRRSW